MNKNSSVLVLGATGLVGSAILANLKAKGFANLLHPTRQELNLLEQKSVEAYFLQHKPDYVFIAAAKVGGIVANNKYRADFIFENLQIRQNIFNAAFKAQTQNMLFLGSSCIYPKNAPQPLKEEYLLTSSLEETNEPYAIAKIAGLKTAESFRRQYGFNWLSVMPTNLYGLNDNFHLENSHVIPGLIARMHQALKENSPVFQIWGSGKPRREFLYVDDMAEACIFFMSYEGEKPSYINIGSGTDIEIGELAKIIASKLGFKGKLVFDTTKPDGTMQKLQDITKIMELGWQPKVDLENGLERVIAHYIRKNIS